MNDDARFPELDDRELLAASAYLDGEADADERALVESRPHVSAWVAEMTSLRDDLVRAPITAPSDQVRESALAAALAAFDGLTAATAPATDAIAAPADTVAAPIALTDRRERRAGSRAARWNPRMALGVAAAAVAVLAIGGIALRDDRSNDTAGDAFSAPGTMGKAAPAPEIAAAAEASTDDVTSAEQGLPLTDAAATEAAPAELDLPLDTSLADAAAAGGAAEAAAAPADTEAPAATEAPAEAPAMTTSEGTAVVATGAALLTIADADALTAYATTARGDGFDAPCGPAGTTSLGVVDYAGRIAAVTLDPASGAVAAYSLDTCELLVSVVP